MGPDFSRTLLKKVTLVKVGGDVVIECKPKASPKPVYTWKKGRDRVRESERYCLEILSIFHEPVITYRSVMNGSRPRNSLSAIYGLNVSRRTGASAEGSKLAGLYNST